MLYSVHSRDATRIQVVLYTLSEDTTNISGCFVHTHRLNKVLHSVEGLVGEVVALVVVVLLHGLEEHVIDGRVEGRRVGRHLAVGVLAVQVVLGRRAQRQQEHVATELYRLHTKDLSVG